MLAGQKVTVEFGATHPGQSHVQDETVGLAQFGRTEEFFRRGEHSNVEVGGSHQPVQRLTDRLIVVDN